MDKPKIIKRRLSIVIALMALVAIYSVNGTVAYYNANYSTSDEAITGNYAYHVNNLWQSPENWMPGESHAVDLSIQNKGTAPLIVRASIEETWKDKEGRKLENYYNKHEVVLKNVSSNWIKYGPYYYYTEELKQGETSSSILNSLTLNENLEFEKECIDIDDETRICSGLTYADASYEIKVNFYLIQATGVHDMWKLSSTMLQQQNLKKRLKEGSYVSFDNQCFIANSLIENAPIGLTYVGKQCNNSAITEEDKNNLNQTLFTYRDYISNYASLENNIKLEISQYTPYYSGKGTIDDPYIVEMDIN